MRREALPVRRTPLPAPASARATGSRSEAQPIATIAGSASVGCVASRGSVVGAGVGRAIGRTRMARRLRTRWGAGLAVLLGASAVAACDSAPPPGPQPGPSTVSAHTRLDFGVWGPPAEVAAYRALARDYNLAGETDEVEVTAYDSEAALMADIARGEAPDVFLATRRSLPLLTSQQLNVPLLETLDERGIDFGDNYSRDATLAFSTDDELQCMPYGVSPLVMYVNTELVDFARMGERGLPVPEPEEDNPDRTWSLEQFQAAAEFATRPARGTRGLHVAPTLWQLAPFVYSGGGRIFDDDDDPRSLALSDDGSREALARALPVLRDPRLTLTDRQLARASALAWFKRGKLGMIEGDRALTPLLRSVPDLRFDVMPLPALDDEVTVGEISGLCISRDASGVARAADFLVHAVSNVAVSRVVDAGYLVPANLQVALSDDFLQPGREPEHASVFNTSVRHLRLPPLLEERQWRRLEEAVSEDLRALLTQPVIDLETLTAQIDDKSRAVLDLAGSGSPSPAP